MTTIKRITRRRISVESFMDDSLKEILFKHWHVLVRYINPTDNLIGVLVDDKVLPSSMIDDVKKGTNRKEKNERLLKALKLRGNISYRKFREAMMKCGQIFVADLLFEEECMSNDPPLIEEGDLSMFPSLKLSLNPEEMQRVCAGLDARVKFRLLKSDWRQNSDKRLEALQNKCDDQRTQQTCQSYLATYEDRIRKLQEEINTKNDLVRQMSLEVNVLNHDINNFFKRHRVTTSSHVTTNVSHANSATKENSWATGRFRAFENALIMIGQRIEGLLGESLTSSEGGTTLCELDQKTKQLQELIREMEDKLYTMTRDREEGLGLLNAVKKGADVSTQQGVQKFLQQEQRNKSSLLKGIDTLSRKLRGIESHDPNSGHRALLQSAVTGKPPPEIIDYRFLANHIALLSADAEHIAKKLTWKDTEVKALRSEVIGLRRRFMCRKESPEFTPQETELCD